MYITLYIKFARKKGGGGNSDQDVTARDVFCQQLASCLIDGMSAAGRKMFVYVFVTI